MSGLWTIAEQGMYLNVEKSEYMVLTRMGGERGSRTDSKRGRVKEG